MPINKSNDKSTCLLGVMDGGDMHAGWIVRQAHLMARPGALGGRDLVCYHAPARCHGETPRRLCEAITPQPGVAPTRTTETLALWRGGDAACTSIGES